MIRRQAVFSHSQANTSLAARAALPQASGLMQMCTCQHTEFSGKNTNMPRSNWFSSASTYQMPSCITGFHFARSLIRSSPSVGQIFGCVAISRIRFASRVRIKVIIGKRARPPTSRLVSAKQPMGYRPQNSRSLMWAKNKRGAMSTYSFRLEQHSAKKGSYLTSRCPS